MGWSRKNVLPGAFECKLFRAWSGLGELLAILLQTDKIIESRPAIKNDWNIYCRAMGTAQHNPAQFGVTADALRSLITAIATVEAQVMAGNGLRVGFFVKILFNLFKSLLKTYAFTEISYSYRRS
ncbi:unnamed protein product [Strongylus vulgaris]|uniref:WASH complex subunit 4 N-terminal domain-containing protein n=1 Tax=Strongylus vulgaris TaxID=40348 RepID=A0A3P7K5Q7_STRVU|nr:unnamed protein product [Strongylus vulgaris]